MEEPRAVKHADRSRWLGLRLNRKEEGVPFWKALLQYRQRNDRLLVEFDFLRYNLVSSRVYDGTHLPIVDLDFPHEYVPSSTPGHAHLYLDVPVQPWRWRALMVGLYLGGVIEWGYLLWSLRRGANFVRAPHIVKPTEESLGGQNGVEM